MVYVHLSPQRKDLLQISFAVVICHHLYHVMKHFCPDGTGFIEDDNVPIYRTQWVTEWLDWNEKLSPFSRFLTDVSDSISTTIIKTPISFGRMALLKQCQTH